MSGRVEINGKPITLVRELGAGTTGVVHEGKTVDGQRVAVKFLHEHLCSSSEAVARHSREITALSKLTHPSSVRLYGHGETDDGRFYIVMELLEGEPLDALVRREAPLALNRILPMFLELTSALIEAHEMGLIHRDIKPENLYVVHDKGYERIKLMDFGFVRFSTPEFDDEHSAVTSFGTVLGTPGFMSPSMARGLQAEERGDVYSLAVTLYECLTGKLPFDGKDALQIMVSQAQRPPVDLDKRIKGLTFPPELVGVVMRAMQTDPTLRTPTSLKFALELRAAIATMALPPPPRVNPIVARGTTDTGPARVTEKTVMVKRGSSSKLPIAAAVAGIALIAAIGAFFALRHH